MTTTLETIDLEPPDTAAPPVLTAKESRVKARGRGAVALALGWLIMITLLTLFHGALGMRDARQGNPSAGKIKPTWDLIPWLDGDGFQFREPLPKPVDPNKPADVTTESTLKKVSLDDIFGDTTTTVALAPGEVAKPVRPTSWALGSDRNGRDILSRSLAAAKISLAIAAAATILGILGGALLGLYAGFFGKKTDTGISWATDVILSVPPLVLLISLSATIFAGKSWQNNPLKVILPLGFLAIPPITRLVRAQTLVYAQRDFVTAARSLGAQNNRILFREILPNIVPSLLSFSLTTLGVLVVAEGALSVFGLSLQADTPTWGNQIREGRELLQDAWWISIIPATFLFLTVLSVNVLGDRLSNRFAVKEAVG
jgi:peptide/nickel transport system permease protein